jgi:AcrR family transcriptional regulator
MTNDGQVVYPVHVAKARETTKPPQPDDVPQPPWRAAAKRPPARTPLSQEAIVDAALRVLDREGVDRLSMRRVAAELGTAAGALYWHVANKEELLLLLVDKVTTDIRLPQPDPSRWQEQVREVAHEMLRVCRAHRDIGRITLGRIPIGPNLVRMVEWQLALLRGAGLPDRVAGLVGDLLGLYIGAFAYEETLGFSSPDGKDRPVHEIVAMIHGYFASLPPDRFPNTVAMADALVAGGPDERFEFGLDVIIRGLASYLPSGA